ncbi:MAG: aspartate/glutamate racemase family protein, partial [Paracoccaceae bacterium]|nr:aspartate/glutamate racemase family protein [Paracoccaceae bacterium]
TVLLMQKIIAATPARDDDDHIPLIVHQNTQVPSRIKALIDHTGPDPAPTLCAMARALHVAGAQALAMPCNTAHAYAAQISAATPLPFLDMIASTTRTLPKGARVGMLASPATRLAGVFDAPFAACGLTPVYLPDDAPLLLLIRRIKSGDTGPDAAACLQDLARALFNHSDHLLIACTELSLLSGSLQDLAWTDSLDCLTTAITDFALS